MPMVRRSLRSTVNNHLEGFEVHRLVVYIQPNECPPLLNHQRPQSSKTHTRRSSTVSMPTGGCQPSPLPCWQTFCRCRSSIGMVTRALISSHSPSCLLACLLALSLSLHAFVVAALSPPSMLQSISLCKDKCVSKPARRLSPSVC